MDENQSAASSPAEPSIPKSRLDEMIQRNRELQEQNRFMSSQLGELIQQNRRAQAPVQTESPEMARLKEENPVLHRELTDLRGKNRNLTASLYSMHDRQDRAEFVGEFGAEGKKKLADVERILENERTRTNGRTEATRSGIYMWLLGQERLRAEQGRAAAPAQPPAPRAPEATQEAQGEEEAPASDPRAAATLSGGTASRNSGPLSIEDEEKALSHIVF